MKMAIAHAWPPRLWKDTHVVLAVSGGADSVALLQGMLRLKRQAGGSGRLYAGHLNHGLRASAADDASWVDDLCRELEVPLEVGSTNVGSRVSTTSDGLEAAARDARYEFLREFAERIGARNVAVAHTADDQVETVLHRVIRGTGLAGLSGIPFSRPLSPVVSIVRPLLSVRRREVLQYLAGLRQDYRSDDSNLDLRFTRNRMRHELLPNLRASYNTEVDKALLQLAAQSAESQAVIAELAAELVEGCISIDFGAENAVQGERIRINCALVVQHPRLLIRESLKLAWTQAGWPLQDIGYKEWEEMASLVAGENDASVVNLPGRIRAARDHDVVILRFV